ncbi:helix-turn-helix domain-containing protein [Streptomyces sp. NPDC001530]|uniref:helix-turn-helix domain-containing protein n=1 Tax=Streptomyces sp. NPDC001530 TaxID=3364582 RepID=UPI003683954C
MVETGHAGPLGHGGVKEPGRVAIEEPDRAAIKEVDFRNPVRPGLSVETFALAELRRRVPAAALAQPQRLDFHQIFLITSGHGRYTVDFVDHECGPGTLLWLRPNQVQENAAAPGLDGHAVLFTPAFLPPSQVLRGLLEDQYETAVWHLDAPEALRTLTATVVQLAEDYATACGMSVPAGHTTATPPLGIELLRHQLTVLLLRIAALPTPPGAAEPGAVPDETYLRFRREVEQHFHRTRQVEDYAQFLGYSAKTLNRACQAATGHTAKQVVDRRVVLEAKRLLAHTDLTAAAIAQRLGFTEATNFGKYFTHHTGMPPGDFRTGHTG